MNVTTSRASLDTTGVNSAAAYDLKKGLLSCSVTFNDPGFASSSVAAEDLYRIVGLPAGTPVDFSASFIVSGSWNVFPGVPQGIFSSDGEIQADADSAEFSIPSSCCHATFSQPLTISLHRLAQTIFSVRLLLDGSANRGGVSETGQLAFTGLPATVAVVSCQGFTSNAAVPVRRRSWEALKAIYR